MRVRRILMSVLTVGLLLALSVSLTTAQGPKPAGVLRVPAGPPPGTAFTYQGRLIHGGVPVSDTCALWFRLWDAASGGSQIDSTLARPGIEVIDGLFNVGLDFGADAFDGDPRWLEIEVDCLGTGGVTLSPRQQLTPVPYAYYAYAAPWNGLSGVPAGFADGVDDDTTYTASTGLSLAGAQFSVATTYRLPQSCGSGQIAEWNGSAWDCTADDDTTYTAGTGLGLAGAQFSLYQAGRFEVIAPDYVDLECLFFSENFRVLTEVGLYLVGCRLFNLLVLVRPDFRQEPVVFVLSYLL